MKNWGEERRGPNQGMWTSSVSDWGTMATHTTPPQTKQEAETQRPVVKNTKSHKKKAENKDIGKSCRKAQAETLDAIIRLVAEKVRGHQDDLISEGKEKRGKRSGPPVPPRTRKTKIDFFWSGGN